MWYCIVLCVLCRASGMVCDRSRVSSPGCATSGAAVVMTWRKSAHWHTIAKSVTEPGCTIRCEGTR